MQTESSENVFVAMHDGLMKSASNIGGKYGFNHLFMLEILRFRIRGGNITEIVAETGFGRSTVSKYIKILREIDDFDLGQLALLAASRFLTPKFVSG